MPSALADSTELPRDLASWAGCIAGALTDEEYRRGLAAVGFEQIDLEVSRRYSMDDLQGSLPTVVAHPGEQVAVEVAGRFVSMFVRATKPVG